MNSCKTRSKSIVRLFLSVVVLFLISTVMLNSVAAKSTGYISPNENDLPPDMDREVGPISTDPDLPPAYGPEDAKVLVLIFADYRCPACRRASQATHQIAAEYPGEVRMEFWNNPLEMHKNADLGAMAGIAAQRQGKFWEMHDLIFAGGKHDQADLEAKALELDLDLDQFRADMNDPAVRERVLQERDLANALGATNTPSDVVNGKVYMGWGGWKSLKRKVDRELAKVNELEDQGMSLDEIRLERAIENNTDSTTFELYQTNILESGAYGAGE